MTNFDAVLKVGGSLSRGQNLAALCQTIGRLGSQYRLLIVPGGGDFADTVRDHYRRYHVSETTTHRMALLAMDQYGWLLSDLIPDSAAVRDVLAAREAAANGRVSILLAATLLIEADPLPHSWQVTSDSIAAWIAGLVGAVRCVLLKDVDGLFSAQSGSAQTVASHVRERAEGSSGRRGRISERGVSVARFGDVGHQWSAARSFGRIVERRPDDRHTHQPRMISHNRRTRSASSGPVRQLSRHAAVRTPATSAPRLRTRSRSCS